MINALRVFQGGYCRQLLALVDRRSWRLERFPARFLALQHSQHGWILVDTGYGTSLGRRIGKWPYWLYGVATPVTSRESTLDLLEAAGIHPGALGYLIVTHFHVDHIGGLSEFHGLTTYFHKDALAPLQRLSPLKQVHAAFVPSLLPADFETQARPIPDESFFPHSELPFRCHDLFGDGSVQLVLLPGHAPGHLGVYFRLEGKPILYVADAYWRSCQIDEDGRPTSLALRFQWDRAAYEETVRKLKLLKKENRLLIASCHDQHCLEALADS